MTTTTTTTIGRRYMTIRRRIMPLLLPSKSPNPDNVNYPCIIFGNFLVSQKKLGLIFSTRTRRGLQICFMGIWNETLVRLLLALLLTASVSKIFLFVQINHPGNPAAHIFHHLCQFLVHFNCNSNYFKQMSVEK